MNGSRDLSPRAAWAPAIVACFISVMLGGWFATRQVQLLDATAAYPPLRLMLGTASYVAIITFIFFAYCYAYVTRRNPAPYASWLPLLGLLPLLGVFTGISFTWALRSSLLAFAVVCLFNFVRLRAKSRNRTADKHLWSFGAVMLVQIFCNGYFSPLHYAETPFHIPGELIPQIAVISPLYRAFIWIKQFSLSDIDYAYWHIGPAIGHASLILQGMALLADSPSMNIVAFYHLLHWFFFFACVIGSFGFYLFLHIGMRLRWSLSTAFGMLYVFGQQPFFTYGLDQDYTVEISVMVVLPFSLCAIFYALRKSDVFWASVSGAILAFSIVLMMPHPELILYSVLYFSLLSIVLACRISSRIPMKRSFFLMVCSGIWFCIISTFFIGPLFLAEFSKELFIGGHNETTGHYTLADVPWFSVLHAVAAYKSFFFLKRALKDKKANIIHWALFILIILLLPLHSPLLMAFGLLHLPVNLYKIYYSRRALFISVSTMILLACALNQGSFQTLLVKRIRERLPNLRLSTRLGRIVILLTSAAVCILFPLRPDTSANPEHCQYYVLLEALLANYPLLKGDEANIVQISERLKKFEKDIQSPDAVNYLRKYKIILNENNTISSTEIHNPEQIYAFARQAAYLVDQFYTDQSLSCVHPAEGRYVLGNKVYLLPNIASLYSALPTPFLRSGSYTAGESMKALVPNSKSGDIIHGSGPGMFIVNSGTDYDARNYVAAPLLHALYLMPGYNFKPIFPGYDNNRNWLLPAAMWLNPLYRKVLDIAGIDVVMTSRQRLMELTAIPGFEPFEQSHPPTIPGLNEAVLLYNRRSYGMAYLANQIKYIGETETSQIEQILRGYLIATTSRDEIPYIQTRGALYAELNDLQNYHDIILEAPPRAQETGTAGNVSIHNILGEASVMTADCQRDTCELVYNYAKQPGWHAYVDGKATQIARANFAFMAISVPRGIHEIWFVYAPFSSFCFAMLSLLGFALLPYWFYVRRPSGNAGRL